MALLADSLSDRVAELAGPPEQIVMGLERMRAALAALKMSARLPMPVMLVGGTNGKGSTVVYLEAFYRQAGYRVGAYTSPHLWQFTERLRLDGRSAPESLWHQQLTEVAATVRQIPLTYFEIATLAAVRMMLATRVDVAILEVGLGGRLDAVNAFTPDCSIVTTVDLDHQDWLGSDRAAIGHEKAGIFRRGVPALYGDTEDPCASVLEAAVRADVPLQRLGRDFHIDPLHGKWSGFGHGKDAPPPLWEGAVQWANLALALAAVSLLQEKLPVSDAAVSAWTRLPQLPGRCQWLQPWGKDGPDLLVDVAHNPQAARQLAALLAARKGSGRCHAVVGMLADKDIAGTLAPLLHWVDAWHVLEITDTPRAASMLQLRDTLRGLGATAVSADASMEQALERSRTTLATGDILLCFGSFHLVKQLPMAWLLSDPS
ncbi:MULTISPECIES: bifunctional folylpolyglutamate synthase/dihydrofolate synthase [Acidithiobacillus]|uniref:Dihydrofolate synthase/folylpolyglutamate synthase n=2 Tax=Acidithiobacillus ferrooxidans TaxID=920 RepID=B7J4S6_ACIF2|nr:MULTISPECIES: cyanophycin synthetase [Acidithiobacillus]MBN6748316.1 bifunctional folylpolyglutamate synthase/dihydrofolate synthase [Acidithiobacillus sp. PG05]MCL5956263.1 Mur ligase family protein [Gammaproteobacteria bacterium]ACH83946.1 FolC bifunctional protein [Acidithiobacillus ferrooxidans ATCC 53993]ACK79908.1 folylpolyglutamate synthase/dihydrofolate synthase [Acidithiobacillus ferrooxidans ATCC 23270]MBN6745407.1 bifunctional folylpolyglutamate synthase/dihydrofolate synthase [A